MINKLDKQDTMFLLLSVVTPLVLWWYATGKRKYDSRGMH